MLRTSLLLLLSIGLQAQEATPEFWIPDPARWQLELSSELGGWWNGSPESLSLVLRDPGDPRPKREPGQDYWDFWQLERSRRATALRSLAESLLRQDPEATPEAASLLAQSWDPERQVQVGNAYGAWACALRARRMAEAELERIRQGRRTPLLIWLNGRKFELTVEPNQPHHLDPFTLKGENRLEVLEPRSGQHLVRTWWQAAGAPRLQVHLEGEGLHEYELGDLRILLPSGKLSRAESRHQLSNPAPGTYSLQWSRRHYSGWWVDANANAPIRIRACVTLDAGTYQERRWTFEALGLPGAPPLTLGSFDVETP